jgi:hypothetical protein
VRRCVEGALSGEYRRAGNVGGGERDLVIGCVAAPAIVSDKMSFFEESSKKVLDMFWRESRFLDGEASK